MNTYKAILATIAKNPLAPSLSLNIACNALQQRFHLRVDKRNQPRNESYPPVINTVIPDLHILSYIKFYGIRITFFVPDLDTFSSYTPLITSIITTWYTTAASSSDYPKYLRIGAVVQARSHHTPRYYGAWISTKWDNCWRPDIGADSLYNSNTFMNTIIAASPIPNTTYKNMYDSWDRYALSHWTMHGL